MKNIMIAAALGAATLASWTAPALAVNVDVSVNIGQPGYYGPIDIRDFGRPRVIYSEPRIIHRVAVEREPVYLHVPPGHAKNWRKHCRKYNACADRVYFVQDGWYDREYVPRYQAKHHNRHEERHEDRDDRKEHREDQRDDRHGDRHNNKKGHGKYRDD